MQSLNGASVIMRTEEVIFVRIPAEFQRKCGTCSCDYCKAHPEQIPTRDTLAIPIKPVKGRVDTCYTVHMPAVKA